jgi:membrane-associated phospholipid phosphatase
MKRDFFKRCMTSEDWWLAACLVLMLLTAGVLIGINAFLFRYTGISYLPRQGVALIFPALEFVAFGLYTRDSSPRAAFIARNGAFYLLMAAATSLLTTGIQYTPFREIDPLLAGWDRALNVDVIGLMAWTYAHRPLPLLLDACYSALNAELILLPLGALCFQDHRRTRIYLYSVMYSSFAGSLFYYFFPSSGPASLLQSPYFSAEQHLTSLKFYEVHHFQEVTTLFGGMVAFPSFHVVWAILLTYAASARKWLLYPVALLNAFVILSTVLLGWHFAVDVLASALLAAGSWFAAARTHEWLCRRA